MHGIGIYVHTEFQHSMCWDVLITQVITNLQEETILAKEWDDILCIWLHLAQFQLTSIGNLPQFHSQRTVERHDNVLLVVVAHIEVVVTNRFLGYQFDAWFSVVHYTIKVTVTALLLLLLAYCFNLMSTVSLLVLLLPDRTIVRLIID